MARTYEAMLKGEGPPKSGGRLLDLKNRQQIGELEKKIIFFNNKNGYKVFNFVCTRGAEGVSTILVNLTNYMAKKNTGKKILLIDTNFQNPTLHTIFNLSHQRGLTDLLKGGRNLSETVQSIDSDKIFLLSCGKEFNSLSGSIEQERFAELLTEIRDQYDYIFIDSAPVLTSADSLSTAIASDVTFMVIKSLSLQKEVAEKAKNMLIANECFIGGVILNNVVQVIPAWFYNIF